MCIIQVAHARLIHSTWKTAGHHCLHHHHHNDHPCSPHHHIAVDSFGSTFHLHLLFKAGHEYRRSFCILQPAICPWGLLTARGFLPEAATPLASGKTAEKIQCFRGKSSSSPPGHHQKILSIFCDCLSPE